MSKSPSLPWISRFRPRPWHSFYNQHTAGRSLPALRYNGKLIATIYMVLEKDLDEHLKIVSDQKTPPGRPLANALREANARH